MPDKTSEGGRLESLDLLRGITLVSMILYHGLWDLLYLSESAAAMTGLRAWYEGTGGYLWQQSICWTFILLSGFCVPFSGHIFRRGLQVSAGGAAVSAVTLLVLYEERVLFGVLTFLGAAMLLTGLLQAPARDLSRRLSAPVHVFAAAASGYLFFVFRQVNTGYLQFWPGMRMRLPSALYSFGGGVAGYGLTGLGFPMRGFFSTDYFSLLPWIFLFWTGLFLHRWLAAGKAFCHPLFHLRAPVLNRMGRHSLLLYLLHQPVLYLMTLLFFSCI